MRRTPLSVLLLILLSGLSLADSGLRVGIDRLVTQDEEVQITLTVTDLLHMGISGLDSRNFGIELPVVDSLLQPSVERSQDAIALVLCLDNSGSMPVDMVKQALDSYLGTIRSQDRVAIIVFNDDVEVVSSFSGNISHLRSRLSSIQRQGNYTEMYLGVYEGLKLLRDATPEGIERRYLLLFSDGYNEYVRGEVYNSLHCTNLASEIGVPVMSVAYEGRNSDVRSMELLSDRTGGFYTKTSTVEGLGQAFVNALSITNSQYFLSFSVPDTLLDSSEHTYTVKVTQGVQSGSAEFTEVFQAPPAPPVKPGLPLWLWIVIVIVTAIIVFGVVVMVRRAAQRKIDVLNDELLSKNDQLTEMEKEMARKAAMKNAPAGGATILPGTSSKPKDPDRFRKTMIGAPPTAQYRTGRLEATAGSDAGKSFDLKGPVVSMGRQDDNSIVLDSTASGQSSVSRHHAEIRIAGGEFMIIDLNSGNGVFVNGRKVQSSPLTDGDQIKLGSAMLVFRGGV